MFEKFETKLSDSPGFTINFLENLSFYFFVALLIFCYRSYFSVKDSAGSIPINSKEQSLNQEIKQNSLAINQMFTVNLIVLLVLFLTFIVLMRLCAKQFIIIMIYLAPISIFISMFFFFNTVAAIIIGLAFCIPFYFLSTQYLSAYIDKFSVIFAAVSEIFIDNYKSIISSVLITAGFTAFQGYLFFTSADSLDLSSPMFCLKLLLLLWSFFITIYFNQVFVSALVSETISKSSSIQYSAIIYTFTCLGSITFGSMLIALVYTASVLVAIKRYQIRKKPNESRKRKKKEESIDSIIIEISLYFLLYIIESILDRIGAFIRHCNSFVFSYVGIENKTYYQSVKETSKDALVTNIYSYAMLKIFNYLSFLMFALFWSLSFLINRIYIYPAPISDNGILISFTLSLLFAVVFYIFLSLYHNAMYALSYKYAKNAEEVKNYNKKLFYILRENAK